MKSPKLDPSPLRKIVITISAALATFAFFGLLFGASYLVLPPSNDNIDPPPPIPDPAKIQTSNQSTDQQLTDVYTKHAHTALLIFVNGKPLDFSSPRYQNQDLLMHFENGDGFTLHKHDKRSWLGYLLASLNMTLADNCLSLATGLSYCSNFDSQIRFYVNNIPNSEYQHYLPRDGDRILISYGNAAEVDGQLDQLNSIPIVP
jgi:hypothetical protein